MKFLKYLLLFACFIPLFLFRDFTPNNELKYLSIANEALQNGNIFTFWNHGMVYADKPPLYLWIIMLGKWLLGMHSMLFIGIFSLIPALVILYIMDKWVGKYLPANLRYSGQLMLITSGLFLGSAIVVRMDMLMCMFIVLALYTFYKLYTGENSKYDPLKLPLYIFLAVFTKGPVGLLVPLLCIPVFLIVKKQIKSFGKYLGWKQWSVLLGLCVIWFGSVYLEGGDNYLNNLLFHQTVNRAIDSFHHKEPLWFYLKTIWYSLAPWVLLYVTVLVIGIKKHLLNNDLKKFFFVIIATTFIALSISSAKLDIYLLPIFPFVAYLAFLFLPDLNMKTIRFTIAIPAIILCLIFPALFIAGPYISFPLPAIPIIPVASFILAVFAGRTLFFLWKNNTLRATNSLAIGLLLAIFTASFAIPKLNQYIGFKEMCGQAETIAHKNNIQNYYYYKFRSGENMDAYLNREITSLDISGINSLNGKQKFILFVRNKDLRRENELQNIVDAREKYVIGDYSVIVF